MNPTSLLAVLTTFKHWLLGFKSSLIMTPRSFSVLVTDSTTPFIKHSTLSLLIPICMTLHPSTLNFICQSRAQLLNLSISLWSNSLSSVVITLLAIFVSSANILQVRPLSRSLTLLKKRTGPRRDLCGTLLWQVSAHHSWGGGINGPMKPHWRC